MLGIRRGRLVDGVYYKELSPESLSRALSRRGAGYKDYRVTFPALPTHASDRAGRQKQIIRCSNRRVFADLMGPIGIERLEPLLTIVRPGGRILEFNSGTGYRAQWLSFVVGPSGGVVAIACDHEDAAFARLRYRRPNVSFEVAENFALAGEMDGAFNAVVALSLVGDEAGRLMLLRELWRLTAPGGALLVGGLRESEPGASTASAQSSQADLEAELREMVDDEAAAIEVRTGPHGDVDVLITRASPNEQRPGPGDRNGHPGNQGGGRGGGGSGGRPETSP